jgi:hypothetical protein
VRTSVITSAVIAFVDSRMIADRSTPSITLSAKAIRSTRLITA